MVNIVCDWVWLDLCSWYFAAFSAPDLKGNVQQQWLKLDLNFILIFFKTHLFVQRSCTLHALVTSLVYVKFWLSEHLHVILSALLLWKWCYLFMCSVMRTRDFMCSRAMCFVIPDSKMPEWKAYPVDIRPDNRLHHCIFSCELWMLFLCKLRSESGWSVLVSGFFLGWKLPDRTDLHCINCCGEK